MRVEVDVSTPLVEGRSESSTAIGERLSAGYERLKPGPGQTPELVRASQRDRIHRAMIELASDVGIERVTVRALTRTAGISSRTFYSNFANRDECLASTVAGVGRELLCRAAPSRHEESDWRVQVRTTLDSLMGDLARHPKTAQLMMVEVFAAGRPARTCATELTEQAERLVARLLAAAEAGPPRPPHRLVVGITAGVVRVATMTTLTRRTDELPALSSELADWVIGTYDEPLVSLGTKAPKPQPSRRREPSPFPAELSGVAGRDEVDRILSATSRIAATGGFAKLTASRIRREAGVSRRSFDQRFGQVTRCFLVAVESLARRAALRADAWAAGTGRSEHRTYRLMLALCVMAARNQPQATLVLATILAPGREGLRAREQLISGITDRLADAPQARAAARPRLATEASVAGAWRIAQRELVTGRGDRLPQVAPLLSTFVAGRPAADSPG